MASSSRSTEFHHLVENLEENVLECPLCLNRLKDPKALPCQHAFCFLCLQDWVNKKGVSICPTCLQSFHIPDGGLHKLPPNIFINNLLETIDQLEDPKPICRVHKKSLEFYCKTCKIPVCVSCKTTDHNESNKEHQLISILQAFTELKNQALKLEKDVKKQTQVIKTARKMILYKATILDQNRKACKEDITNFVQDMVETITDNGEELINHVDEIYEKKKNRADRQITGLDTITLDIDRTWSTIDKLLKANKATAMQSGPEAIASLQKTIQQLPDTEPKDDGEMHVYLRKHYHTERMEQRGLGSIVETRQAKCLEITNAPRVLTQGQTFDVEILNSLSEIQVEDDLLKATLTSFGQETELKTVRNDEGNYMVSGVCRNGGVWNLNVSLSGEPIKGSPVKISIEEQGLVKTIKSDKIVHDVAISEEGIIVAGRTNEILKFKQSGEYVGTLTLPSTCDVSWIYKMRNNDAIIYCDGKNKNIGFCTVDGENIVTKIIGGGVLKDPSGIDVDENSNEVYVADRDEHCVLTFDIHSGQVIRRIGSHGQEIGQLHNPGNVNVTKDGNLIIVDIHRIQLFDCRGRFLKVLVDTGDYDGKVTYPKAVAVDKDGNIIVTSFNKLQLFNSDGKFIRRIDKVDELFIPKGLAIVSENPRRVAVANQLGKTVNIYNY
ncbi:RING finger protein nhl-1-like [Anneissia japonica]|uniref:RING finger protein nhl-1-like n=1 Tax=Anneissia japonica TaxID=1529436 RepID=UPI001425A732|nr:RING finger protein nhl-1-like [Anneissia japonica]